MHIDRLTALHYLPVVGVEVRNDGHVLGGILIILSLERYRALHATNLLVNLIAELACKDGVAIHILEWDVELEQVAVASVEREVEDLWCGRCGRHIVGMSDYHVSKHVGILAVGLALQLVGAGRGESLGRGEGVGLGVVGKGSAIEHDFHVDAPCIEVAQEVLWEFYHVVSGDSALDPCLGNPLADALDVDIAAIESHLNLGSVVLGGILAKLQVLCCHRVGFCLQVFGRSNGSVAFHVIPANL